MNIKYNYFGYFLTGEQIIEKNINLNGKVIIITGANSGIGKETTKILSRKGAEIIMATRNQKKSKKLISQILNENKNAKISSIPIDLADLNSIDTFVSKFLYSFNDLNILINNAGVMNTPKKKTKDVFYFI
jgi:NADP-dependent 3-hydroxy acid dehydrogenase YdfG